MVLNYLRNLIVIVKNSKNTSDNTQYAATAFCKSLRPYSLAVPHFVRYYTASEHRILRPLGEIFLKLYSLIHNYHHMENEKREQAAPATPILDSILAKLPPPSFDIKLQVELNVVTQAYDRLSKKWRRVL